MTTGKPSPRWRVSRVVAARAGRLVAVTVPVAVALLAGIAGCGGTDDRPATWPYISTAILEPSCATANCHSAIAARASVDLSDRTVGYTSLTARNFVITRAEVTTAGVERLTDDERVARSAVPQLMRAVGNLRMPPDMPLPETDIALFEKWIRAGATKD